jgi:ParB family transcriptional regulator, chromosome partitioning protein
MEVRDIKLDDINVTENVRLSKGDVQIKQLMESIKQHGLKEPIGVAKNHRGYILLYGYRRYEAYKKLGYNTIPAVIGEEEELKNQLIINMLENIQRRDITPFELGRICEKLVNSGLTPGEIASRLSVTIGTIQKALMVYKRMPKSIRDRVVFTGPGKSVQKGDLSAHVVHIAVQIAKSASLDNNELTKLLEGLRTEKIAAIELQTVAALLKNDLSLNEAIKESREYHVHRIDIPIKKSEIVKIKKENAVCDRDAIMMAVYGLVDSFTKPKFVRFITKKEK